MSEPLQMDLGLGRAARDDGMAQAAQRGWTPLQQARAVAYGLCRANGSVTIDDVREAMKIQSGEPGQANWIGSVFRGADFEPTGEFVQSRIPGNHARAIRVWRLA